MKDFNIYRGEIDLKSALWYTTTHGHTDVAIVKGHKMMAERNFINLTITVTKEERKALKQIALDNDISVSSLIRKWLSEHQDYDSEKKNHGGEE